MADEKHDFRISVKGLIFDEQQKLMILKEVDGMWDLPGGTMEQGESIEQALKREINEEIGVDCEIVDPQPLAIISGRGGKDQTGPWRVQVGFKIKIPNTQLTHSDEFADLGYFDSVDIDTLNLFPLTKQFIKKFLK